MINFIEQQNEIQVHSNNIKLGVIDYTNSIGWFFMPTGSVIEKFDATEITEFLKLGEKMWLIRKLSDTGVDFCRGDWWYRYNDRLGKSVYEQLDEDTTPVWQMYNEIEKPKLKLVWTENPK